MEEEVDEEYERLCGSVVGSLYIEDKRISDSVMGGLRAVRGGRSGQRRY